ncbi:MULTISPECIES: peptide-methionine (S)-S-oxide reductase MsrA [unclassified Gordonia (in: high G+C Gram-positive bacteria)]|jgi:peptide-methionine (S)-S-oxide reductase|uniref:peptide-methionine (S)-S-oxide reductase MsrA n=1 Tax=unclassified Gordonia (in: high G+C Gram-positive bacteria) TaxID=2657482 RepID=UPI001964B40D|nr:MULTISPECIES: peptide-methionine (S)-S-oxide reductase MsrA [unclassified Gordonia (in: high G+C Gram-positive bacteria)]MBN0971006.1 peptide-methionine (S)-S-oxide reductase MsrA [Gordonia sp. BP-119]MBN0982414.1 peptide-methionine (S)-S-oxide reductase MsrA [Gordonia sp. BP-94]
MSWLDQLFAAGSRKQDLVAADAALPGRSSEITVPGEHLVLGTPMRGRAEADGSHVHGIGRFDDGLDAIVLAGGCFWGIEEIFWQVPGVYTTAVGYAGGYTPNPTYEETCTARTGHTESALVVFDPAVVDLEGLLKVFWESHDPTQEMRQGNDIGTQYRSAVYALTDADLDLVRSTAATFQTALDAAGEGAIATEIKPLAQAGDGRFYYAEDHHQQYLAKNPHGYRCHAATGVAYPA